MFFKGTYAITTTRENEIKYRVGIRKGGFSRSCTNEPAILGGEVYAKRGLEVLIVRARRSDCCFLLVQSRLEYTGIYLLCCALVRLVDALGCVCHFGVGDDGW